MHRSYVHTPTVITCENALMILIYTGWGYATELYATGVDMWTCTMHQSLFK